MLRAQIEFADKLHIVCSHNLDQLFERCLLRIPSQQGTGFGGVSQQLLDFGRTEILGINLNQHLAALRVDTLLVDTFTLPAQVDAYLAESQCGKLANRMHLTGSDDEVLRSLVLQDEILRSYASIDAFLKQGLGYVALDGERIIANLISSGSYEKSIVLGADTDSEYRCRKIAASLLRSAQCYADEHGLSLVWECNKDNIASVGTAEKCGLERRFTYPVRWFELK